MISASPVIPRHLQHPPEADAPRRVHTGTITSSQPQQRPSFPTSAPDIMPADTSTMCPGCASDGVIHNAPCDTCSDHETLPSLSQSSATYYDQYGATTVGFNVVLINGERDTCHQFPSHDSTQIRADDPGAAAAFQAWLSTHSADAHAHTP